MESALFVLLAKHGDIVVMIVAVIFLYLKINTLSSKVSEIYKNQMDHWKFHLCNQKEKGE
jgi:hypothetical protein